MFYNKEIQIYNVKDGYTDINTGIYYEGGYDFNNYDKNLMVDIQPYSKDKLIKDYGYEIDVSKRIFCDIDDSISETTVLKYNDLQLEVKKIIEWDDYLEIMAMEVV